MSVLAQMELKPNSEVALIYGERNIPLNIALNYEDECILVKIHRQSFVLYYLLINIGICFEYKTLVFMTKVTKFFCLVSSGASTFQIHVIVNNNPFYATSLSEVQPTCSGVISK